MANHVNRNNFDENAEDIHNDVSQLADTLEEVLKSWGSDAKEEAEAARVKAQSLLKETRARLNGHNRVQQAALDARQAACDALGCADTYVRNKPAQRRRRSRRRGIYWRIAQFTSIIETASASARAWRAEARELHGI